MKVLSLLAACWYRAWLTAGSVTVSAAPCSSKKGMVTWERARFRFRFRLRFVIASDHFKFRSSGLQVFRSRWESVKEHESKGFVFYLPLPPKSR